VHVLRVKQSRAVWCAQDESCIAGHLGERAPRAADDEAADMAAEEAGAFAVKTPENCNGSQPGDFTICWRDSTSAVRLWDAVPV
jgi:hypothetical protein